MKNDFNINQPMREILRLDMGDIKTTLFGDVTLRPEIKKALTIAKSAERILEITEEIEHVLLHGEEAYLKVSAQVKIEQEPWQKKIDAHQVVFYDAQDAYNKAQENQKEEMKKNLNHVRDVMHALKSERNRIQTKAMDTLKASWGHCIDLGMFIAAIRIEIGRGKEFMVKAAKTTELAAQMYINNEIDALTLMDSVGVSTVQDKYIPGLREQASFYYTEAADILNKEGQTKIAEKLKLIVDDIHIVDPVLTPSELVAELFRREDWQVGYANQQMMGNYNGHRIGYEPEHCQELIETLDKIENEKISIIRQRRFDTFQENLSKGVQSEVRVRKKATFIKKKDV